MFQLPALTTTITENAKHECLHFSSGWLIAPKISTEKVIMRKCQQFFCNTKLPFLIAYKRNHKNLDQYSEYVSKRINLQHNFCEGVTETLENYFLKTFYFLGNPLKSVSHWIFKGPPSINLWNLINLPYIINRGSSRSNLQVQLAPSQKEVNEGILKYGNGVSHVACKRISKELSVRGECIIQLRCWHSRKYLTNKEEYIVRFIWQRFPIFWTASSIRASDKCQAICYTSV